MPDLVFGACTLFVLIYVSWRLVRAFSGNMFKCVGPPASIVRKYSVSFTTFPKVQRDQSLRPVSASHDAVHPYGLSALGRIDCVVGRGAVSQCNPQNITAHPIFPLGIRVHPRREYLAIGSLFIGAHPVNIADRHPVGVVGEFSNDLEICHHSLVSNRATMASFARAKCS